MIITKAKNSGDLYQWTKDHIVWKMAQWLRKKMRTWRHAGRERRKRWIILLKKIFLSKNLNWYKSSPLSFKFFPLFSNFPYSLLNFPKYSFKFSQIFFQIFPNILSNSFKFSQIFFQIFHIFIQIFPNFLSNLLNVLVHLPLHKPLAWVKMYLRVSWEPSGAKVTEIYSRRLPALERFYRETKCSQ